MVKALRENKKSHQKCVTLGYLNINSIEKSFSDISCLIENNLDIFIVAETKLDSSFPESLFLVEGMTKPCRLDIPTKKGALLVFVNKDISSKCLQSFHLPGDIQAIPFEKSLKQRTLLAVSIYRSPDQKLDYFLSSITIVLDHYLQNYEDFIILGDFNEVNITQECNLF